MPTHDEGDRPRWRRLLLRLRQGGATTEAEGCAQPAESSIYPPRSALMWQSLASAPKTDATHVHYILITDGVCVPDIVTWRPERPERIVNGNRILLCRRGGSRLTAVGAASAAMGSEKPSIGPTIRRFREIPSNPSEATMAEYDTDVGPDAAYRVWLTTLDEDVIQGEFGYEEGEFSVFPEAWHPLYAEGLTPAQAWQRAMDGLREARAEADRIAAENWQRIQAADAAIRIS